MGDTEFDLLPEYCHYRDDGCELADSCLNCSLPACIYDQPCGKEHWLKGRRDREIIRRFSKEGKQVSDLALEFGVSERTIQRALKKRLTDGGLADNG